MLCELLGMVQCTVTLKCCCDLNLVLSLTHCHALQTGSRLARLHDRYAEAPLQWAPLLIVLLQNPSHHLPHSAYTNWLQAASQDTFEDGAEPGILLWKLRLLHQLALAWPAALTAVEVDQNTTSIDVAQLESAWKVLHKRCRLPLDCAVQLHGVASHCAVQLTHYSWAWSVQRSYLAAVSH